MGDYVYKEPKGVKHKVSMRKWSKTFSKRGRWPFIVAEVYLGESRATVQYVTSVWGKMFIVLASPVLYSVGTVMEGLPETHNALKRAFNDKKYGAFGSDVVYKDRGNQWDKLKNLLED